ncbi:hypothetical protein ACIBG4_40495 [Nonomuraea sp. NPDC050383]|uniref:hypothetical protein n=1 Tax=Nonomuraea sp. NPDC050383 TaxID=3364362 RepID=UPI00379CDF91
MTTNTPATLTTRQELAPAAARLRCDHRFPVQPPHGSLSYPGPCQHCGVPHAASSPVADQLREPLAAWLEKAAKSFDDETYEDAIECPSCGDGCHEDHGTMRVHSFCGRTIGADAERCACFDEALAVARAVNGGAS